MNKLLKWLPFRGHKKRVAQKLADIIAAIESIKGDLDLAAVFSMISRELRSAGISNIISVYDSESGELVVKSYELLIELPKGMEMAPAPITSISGYQEVLQTKQPSFFYDRIAMLISDLPVLEKAFSEQMPAMGINSVIAPFVLKGEVIGFIELFSRDLRQSDMDIISGFAQNLGMNLSYAILFHEVKKSEERYHDLFENSQTGFFIINGRKKRFVEVNKRFCELSGYTKAELLQMNFILVFHPEERERINHYVSLRLEGKSGQPESPQDYEARLITKLGETRYIRVIISRFISPDEWFTAVFDRTERHQAAMQIRQLSELNERILNNAPISIITLDKDGCISSVNSSFRKLAEDKTDPIGLCIYELSFFQRERLTDSYRKLLSEGQPFRKENCYTMNLRGEDKYLNIIAVPLFDQRGKVEGAISMALDNTDATIAKMKLEEMNKELERKVASRTAELDDANRRLQEALELKMKFIADASHELRTPLTIMQGNLDLVMKCAGSDCCSEANEMLDLVRKEVEHMSGILADLSILANADSHHEKLKLEKVNLTELADVVCRSLKVLADQKNVAIYRTPSEQPLEIIGDEAKLEKLLLNIVRNAIKYNKEYGWINVAESQENGGAVIRVSDSGIGISQNDLPYIFERFYRADKARSRREGGSGLGLSICKWIADSHGGSIEAQSEAGEGTTFTVFLPESPKRMKSAAP